MLQAVAFEAVTVTATATWRKTAVVLEWVRKDGSSVQSLWMKAPAVW